MQGICSSVIAASTVPMPKEVRAESLVGDEHSWNIVVQAAALRTHPKP